VESSATLCSLLEAAARTRPEHVALEDLPDGRITYGELAALVDATARHLLRAGVVRGDRVGICAAKSIDAVAGIHGVMKAGAAYVPVDPDSPPWRAAYILANCGVRVLIVEARLEAQLRDAFREQGQELPPLLVLEGVGGGEALRAAVTDPGSANAPALPEGDADDVAYILYTSGSTGKPKGVTLTHRNALSFVQWCVDTFDISRNDRFSSHAPFHFDLSVSSICTCRLKHGCDGRRSSAAPRASEPAGLAALVAERRLTVWYSTPSILSMLAQYGKMQRHRLRTRCASVLFAGEVFPVKHLRATKAAVVPGPCIYNLYGPDRDQRLHLVPHPGRRRFRTNAPSRIPSAASARTCAAEIVDAGHGVDVT
jgi:acyl-coenzyme A synthetase/AMP-(fatty) acid ligase